MKSPLTHVVLGLASLALAGCSDTKTTAASAPAPVSAPAPAPSDPGEELVISGPIVVENQVDLAAQRDGVVARIVADTGTKVHKGQLLAELDDRQLSAERQAAEARARSIAADVKNWEAESKVQESDLSRAEAMMKADLITKQELDHVRYKLTASQFEVEREKQNQQNAEASMRALQLEEEKMRIVAPFEGVVARRYVRAGQKVAKDDKLFWVTATSPMTVKFALPEKFAGKVHSGAELTVTSETSPKEKHTARVTMVSPVVDPSSGTIEVSATLLGDAGELRPGMTANIHLDKR
ncbi:MAG: efflux RND transporter periplasmic adaptor subunit [Terriglobales bacterium]|jgi:RND family efflux transporter MFP subunit